MANDPVYDGGRRESADREILTLRRVVCQTRTW